MLPLFLIRIENFRKKRKNYLVPKELIVDALKEYIL